MRRNILSLATILLAGLLAAGCSRGSGSHGGPGFSNYNGSGYGYGSMRKQTIVKESIPKELKSSSYPCYPDGRPYNGPRPPGNCVRGSSAAATEED